MHTEHGEEYVGPVRFYLFQQYELPVLEGCICRVADDLTLSEDSMQKGGDAPVSYRPKIEDSSIFVHQEESHGMMDGATELHHLGSLEHPEQNVDGSMSGLFPSSVPLAAQLDWQQTVCRIERQWIQQFGKKMRVGP